MAKKNLGKKKNWLKKNLSKKNLDKKKIGLKKMDPKRVITPKRAQIAPNWSFLFVRWRYPEIMCTIQI